MKGLFSMHICRVGEFVHHIFCYPDPTKMALVRSTCDFHSLVVNVPNRMEMESVAHGPHTSALSLRTLLFSPSSSLLLTITTAFNRAHATAFFATCAICTSVLPLLPELGHVSAAGSQAPPASPLTSCTTTTWRRQSRDRQMAEL